MVKKILLLITLLAAVCCTAYAEEPAPVKFRMTCAPLSGHDMEHKVCGVFFKSMKKHESLEPAPKDHEGTFIWYIVSPGYHPTMGTNEDDPIIVNVMEMSCLKPMAGLCFSVWISGDMFSLPLLPRRAKEMVNQSVEVYDEWLDVAYNVFKNMCPEPECPEGTVFQQWTKSLSSVSTMNAHPDGDASDIQQNQSR